MGPKELALFQRARGPRILCHCLAEIVEGNEEGQGRFARPVRLVKGAPPIENSWSYSGYACL